MTVKIKLSSLSGADLNTFSLYSDTDGYITPFASNITRASLLAGYTSSSAPAGTTIVRVKSFSACLNYSDVYVDYPFITIDSTSVLSNWTPNVVLHQGETLKWTISGGISIALTTINKPTFDFSTNAGTANIIVEDTRRLISLSLDNLSLTNLNVSRAGMLVNLSFINNSVAAINIFNNKELKYLSCYGNNQSSSVTDQIYIDLDYNSVIGGELHIRNNRTSASDIARANLITKGWTIVDTYTT